MKGKYIQFSTGDDGFPRRNDLDPVKVDAYGIQLNIINGR